MNHKTQTKIIIGILFLIALFVALQINKNNKQKSIPEEKPIATVLYSCNDKKTIETQYYKGETKQPQTPDGPPIPGGSVTISLSDGRKMTLHQTISASGVRYANQDESFVFWNKGNGALILENNEQKSYIGCIAVAPEQADQGLLRFYSNSEYGFSIRLPDIATSTDTSSGYKIDESYKYEQLGPKKEIFGIKFTIPSLLSNGTNLGQDSYLSVEEIPQVSECSASLFVYSNSNISTVNDGGTMYSMATTSDAGLGNRYEETVYAIPGTNPCVAVRYFIHYSVFENYPPGTVKEFDKDTLIKQFDSIRRTLIINQ